MGFFTKSTGETLNKTTVTGNFESQTDLLPIPDKTASTSKKLDSLQRILQEQYPELSLNMSPADEDYYQKGQLFLNKKHLDQGDFAKSLGKGFHEAGHQYDTQVRGFDGKELELKALREMRDSGLDLKRMDPAQVYEGYAKLHHDIIPGKREGSFGFGALKNYMKSGTFKALPYIGPALAGAAAISSEDASAAIPILNEAEALGPTKGSADYEIENPQSSPEARRRALERISK